MNGHDYTANNEHTLFKFVGTKTLFSYWPYIIGIILGIIAIIALIICCSSFIPSPSSGPSPPPAVPIDDDLDVAHRGNKPKDAGNAPALAKRPHTLRDEFGLYRTRGYFPDKQASPAPSGRNTFLPRPSAAPNKSSMLSPKPTFK